MALFLANKVINKIIDPKCFHRPIGATEKAIAAGGKLAWEVSLNIPVLSLI
jgi:hypothetical protein